MEVTQTASRVLVPCGARGSKTHHKTSWENPCQPAVLGLYPSLSLVGRTPVQRDMLPKAHARPNIHNFSEVLAPHGYLPRRAQMGFS